MSAEGAGIDHGSDYARSLGFDGEIVWPTDTTSSAAKKKKKKKKTKKVCNCFVTVIAVTAIHTCF